MPQTSYAPNIAHDLFALDFRHRRAAALACAAPCVLCGLTYPLRDGEGCCLLCTSEVARFGGVAPYRDACERVGAPWPPPAARSPLPEWEAPRVTRPSAWPAVKDGPLGAWPDDEPDQELLGSRDVWARLLASTGAAVTGTGLPRHGSMFWAVAEQLTRATIHLWTDAVVPRSVPRQRPTTNPTTSGPWPRCDACRREPWEHTNTVRYTRYTRATLDVQARAFYQEREALLRIGMHSVERPARCQGRDFRGCAGYTSAAFLWWLAVSAVGWTEPRRITRAVRDEVLHRDNLTCRYCGAPVALSGPNRYHLDHVVPWSLGGASTADNLVVACQPCNRSKSATEWPVPNHRPGQLALVLDISGGAS